MRVAMGVATVLVAAGSSALGQPCGWDAAFGDSGTDGTIHAMVEFDIDGNGVKELVVGGVFTSIGGSASGPTVPTAADNVAYWSHGQWFALGDAPGEIDALAEFQGQLYAGGAFEWPKRCPPNPPGGFKCKDGQVPSLLAKWDGTAWVQVGGVAFGATVRSLVEFEGWLYVGGHFNTLYILDFGPPAGTHIARWNGASWASVGFGVRLGEAPLPAPGVWDMVVYDHGCGPDLYVGGIFREVRAPLGTPVPDTYGIARWDGAGWSAVGTGLTAIEDYPECPLPGGPKCLDFDVGVAALAVYNGALYAGGDFKYANGGAALLMNNIARWEPSAPGCAPQAGAWSALDNVSGATGIPDAVVVDALEAHDDGTGLELFAAGIFTNIDCQKVNNVAKWNNSRWFTLGGGLDDAGGTHGGAAHVWDLLGFGGSLIAGGAFDTAYQCRADISGGGVSVSSRSLGKWLAQCPACPADINCDGAVNVLDLVDLLLCFGMHADPPCDVADINHDCEVNVLDEIELLLQFGKTCP